MLSKQDIGAAGIRHNGLYSAICVRINCSSECHTLSRMHSANRFITQRFVAVEPLGH